MDKESIKRVSALAVAAVLLALLLGNVIFRSPIRDLNMAAAVAVAALAFMVGLSALDGYKSPLLARYSLSKVGFRNHEGQVPLLIKQSRDPENKRIMLLEFENQGIPRETWMDRKEQLEAALNIFILKIADGKDRRHVILHAVPADQGIPEILLFDYDDIPREDFQLILGRGIAGFVTIDLNVNPCVLIGGTPGAGKTKLVQLLAMQSYLKGASVYICDFKEMDFFRQWKRRCHMISDEELLISTLKELVGELQTRKRVFAEAECANIHEYNTKVRDIYSRIIIVFDEFAEVLDKRGLNKEACARIDTIIGYLSTLARQGRAAGIHLILATQRPDATVLPGQIKSLCDIRIAGRCDQILSQIILDNSDADDQIPKDERGLFLTGDGTLFRSYLFDDLDWPGRPGED